MINHADVQTRPQDQVNKRLASLEMCTKEHAVLSATNRVNDKTTRFRKRCIERAGEASCNRSHQCCRHCDSPRQQISNSRPQATRVTHSYIYPPSSYHASHPQFYIPTFIIPPLGVVAKRFIQISLQAHKPNAHGLRHHYCEVSECRKRSSMIRHCVTTDECHNKLRN